MTSGIYKIVNLANNKFYIGSSANIEERWAKHRLLLSADDHINQHLQNAWNKYGEDNFEFLILERVQKDHLLDVEQDYLDLTFCYEREIGYNKARFANSPMKGRKHTQEAIEKIRKASTGKRHSDETKLKISSANKNRIVSQESKKKMSIAKKGKVPYCATLPKTAETRRKISDFAKTRIGTKNPNSRLTKEQVLQLKKDFSINNLTLKELAAKYEVSVSTIKRVKYGKTRY